MFKGYPNYISNIIVKPVWKTVPTVFVAMVAAHAINRPQISQILVSGTYPDSGTICLLMSEGKNFVYKLKELKLGL